MAIPVAGGAPRQLLVGGGDAVLSRDGKSVFFDRERGIWKAQADGSDPRRISRDGGWHADESPDGQTVYFRRWDAILSAPVGGGNPKEVAAGLDDIMAGPSVRGSSIYYALRDRRNDYPVLFRLDPATGKSVEALRMPGAGTRGLSVAPDEKSVLFVVSELKSNLRLAEEFR